MVVHICHICQTPQMSSARIQYMDLNNRSLTQSHQLLEGPLPTQGVFPISSLPLGFTQNSFGSP